MTDQTANRPISEEDAAEYLHMKPRTLARWRREGIGPSHSMVGRKALYLVADLDVFLEVRRNDGAAV